MNDLNRSRATALSQFMFTIVILGGGVLVIAATAGKVEPAIPGLVALATLVLGLAILRKKMNG